MKLNIILLIFSIALFSCDKDKNLTEGGDNLGYKGKVIFPIGDKIMYVDGDTGEEALLFSINSYSNNGWDLSHNGEIRLITERKSGTIYGTTFKLLNHKDGSIIKEFLYEPSGNIQSHVGLLSRDNSLILINPDFDDGIVIIDTEGVVKYRMNAINNTPLSISDYALWLPNNDLIVVYDEKYILRSSPPYTSLQLIKEMNYAEWGNVNVSNDGQKISMYIDKHVYLMDIDGTNLKQVTESNYEENYGKFSPDDKQLLIGSNYVHAPVSGRSTWDLVIIPADGKKYNIDSSPDVIPVSPKGKNSPVTSYGKTLWR